ncbi:hypothetical protein CCP3SC1AL1_690006 [Gammaproteobacteria bacterium]
MADYADYLDRNNAEYNIIPNESTQFPDPLESGNLYSQVVPDYENQLKDPLYYKEDEDIPLYTQEIEQSVVDNTLEYDPLSQRESNTINQRTTRLSSNANADASISINTELTFKRFTTILSESFLGILNDFLVNERPDDMSLFSYIIDVFTKDNRPLFLGVFLVFISIFFIFFSKIKNIGNGI